MRLMEDSPIKNDKPEERIVIADCGEMGDEAVIEEKRQTDEFGDGYESHPSGRLAKCLDSEIEALYLSLWSDR